MSRDFRPFLADMERCCGRVLRYTVGLAFEEFIADDRTIDAVMRNLEIIGEAAKQIPQDFRDQHSDVEWRRIARFRDVAAHH